MIVQTEAVNPRDQVALRTYYESLRMYLASERSSWDTQYRELARYFLPRQQRFNYASVDEGDRKDYYLVDNTGTQALNVLAAGIFSSISSPTDKWFHIQVDSDSLADNQQVQEWLDDAEDVLADVMLKSNFYPTLLTAYREMALYGTTAFAILGDPITTIRCHPYPVGSYYVSGGFDLRPDFNLRIVNKTTRQLVDEFGFKKCSKTIQTQYSSNAGGNKEIWWPVVHTVHKNAYYNAEKPGIDDKPWVSVYYEMSNYNEPQALLRQSGFLENPVITGRWDTVGENFYGESPGMNCLGDVKALQLLQKRKSQAIDKQVNPPMVADPALANQSLTVLPGQVTFANMRDGSPGFKAAYQVQFELQYLLQDINDHHTRINDTLFKSLFLMNSDSDRRQITAEEVRAKQQEKMLVLGPVALRTDTEVLSNSVERNFNLCLRADRFRPMPRIMAGVKFKFVFESILARAQKIQRTANIDRLMAYLGSQVAVNQGVLDNVNLDVITTDYMKDLSIPSNGFRMPDEVAKIRANRAAQQQQQQQADNAQKLALAGQTLSKTDVGSDNALTRMMPAGSLPTSQQ